LSDRPWVRASDGRYLAWSLVSSRTPATGNSGDLRDRFLFFSIRRADEWKIHLVLFGMSGAMCEAAIHISDGKGSGRHRSLEDEQIFGSRMNDNHDR
jgi:hypothetical protein